MSESLDDKVRRLIAEEVAIVPYDPSWPVSFARERDHLRACLPSELVGRIEHFGSTAVPGLAAKPVVDLLVEVTDLERAQQKIVPILEAQRYDYLWRPTRGDDGEPFYAWFIKRDAASGVRTHHIHMVERHFPHWDSLFFRDYLIGHPETAREYERLKRHLANDVPHDRVAYTRGKAAFIDRVTEQAKRHFNGPQ